MRKIITLIVFLLLLSLGAGVLAQDHNLLARSSRLAKRGWFTLDSPFLMRTHFAFGVEEKVVRCLKYTKEKFAKSVAIAEGNRVKVLKKGIERMIELPRKRMKKLLRQFLEKEIIKKL